MVNKVMLIGNLTQPPTFSQLNNGGTVARVKLATNESWNDKATGERKTATEYHTCDVWNKLAETLQKLDLDTGTQVYVEGKLVTKSYEKDGVKKYSTVIKLGGFGSEFRILSKKQATQQTAPTAPVVPTAIAPITPVATEEFDDDIPF